VNRKQELRRPATQPGPRATSNATRESDSEGGGAWKAGVLIFGLALLVRMLFLHATPDVSWPYSSYYRGDADSWLEYVRAIHDGSPYEMGLPTKPPGTAWLMAALWNGRESGILFLKLVWCLMAAGTVVILYATWRRAFGPRVAWMAGLAASAGTGLLLLSTSLNNETPYLLLAAGSLFVFESLRKALRSRRPARTSLALLRIALWSVLNALACLVRVEHVLFFIFACGLLILWWWQAPDGAPERAPKERMPKRVPESQGERHVGGHRWKTALTRGVLSALCFLLPLLPWQTTAFRNIARINTEVRPSTAELPESVRQLEQSLRALPSDEAAVRESRKLPGFARRLGTDFVAATVLHRGGTSLRAEDFNILDSAFGYRPEPLSRLPFITSYGPLNFFQANHAHATGGFNRLGLDDPPPLAGGRSRYPADLLLGPPAPGTLSLEYPPHLRAFNRGYAVGWEWILRNPGPFVRLVARKLEIFWSGASLGFTGYGLPTGISGIQRSVDLVTPDGWIATIWMILVFGICAVGLAVGWRKTALLPWLLFLGSKVIITILFFGYARIGATVTPVVFLLGALAVTAGTQRPAKGRRSHATRWAAVVVVLIVLLEGFRCISGPRITIDGQAIDAGDPFAGPVHVDRRIEVR
jgi:hypothetical protein